MRVLALAVSLAMLPGIAAADVIGPGPQPVSPAPTDCPPGAHARTGWGSHGAPPHCEPSTCEADADCGEDGPCQPMGLCVGERMFGRGAIYTDASAPCESDEDCQAEPLEAGLQPPRCVTVSRCAALPGEPPPPPPAPSPGPDPTVDEPPPPPPPEEPPAAETESSGCGCRAAPGGTTPLWALVALALLVARRRP